MFQTKKYTKNELNEKLSSIQKNINHITEKYNIILDEENCDKVSNIFYDICPNYIDNYYYNDYYERIAIYSDIIIIVFNGADIQKPSISYLYIGSDINKDDLFFIKNKLCFLLYDSYIQKKLTETGLH